MLKKIMALGLSLTILLSMSITAFAGEITSSEEAIIEQAVALVDELDLEENDFVIVTVNDVAVNTRNAGETVKAIQTTNTENGITAVTTIYPYMSDETGELINSFEYSNRQTRNANPTFQFVDTTVTVTAYYNEITNGLTYYRHLGVEASWNSSSSSVSVSNLYVNYDSAGELYDTSYNYISDYYFVSSVIDQNNPAKNYGYVRQDMMPSNRWLLCTNYFEHGGLIHVKLTYTVNGRDRVDENHYAPY